MSGRGAETGLRVRKLTTTVQTPRGLAQAVDGVDLDIAPGEVVGLVGESGSGKSITLRSILRLVREPGHVTGGVEWNGRDLMAMGERELRRVRGAEIAMIFQEPMTALNPVLPVGLQIEENLRAHTNMDAAARRARALELMDVVGIPAAARRLGEYPHQFSGGMRQRVMIAIALASSPKLLLADEPTTALDVTIQDQILKLILDLRDRFGMSVLFVTHDLGVIAATCRWWKQATVRPGANASSAGRSARHMSVAKGQRGLKAQPAGMAVRLGGVPSMESSIERSEPARGTAPSRPRV
jgi:ABC-type dipeptide/oligopeptide/nickel transport system ATPase component